MLLVLLQLLLTNIQNILKYDFFSHENRGSSVDRNGNFKWSQFTCKCCSAADTAAAAVLFCSKIRQNVHVRAELASKSDN